MCGSFMKFSKTSAVYWLSQWGWAGSQAWDRLTQLHLVLCQENMVPGTAEPLGTLYAMGL